MLQVKYPIYIISKGRYDNPITAKHFLKANIDFKIAVEPQEYEQYCKKLNQHHVLKLPFSNLGLGSYPARNFCWDHSIKLGYKKHFIFDDNIYGFVTIKKEKIYKRVKCEVLPALDTLIKFDEKFKNIAISGYNYRTFARNVKKPFYLNCHVYSGMLITNEIPFRWRLKYNEDVDLCLQALDTKYWCTVLLNAYLLEKTSTTSKMKGGNQTELYQNNDPKKKLLKTRMLEKIWPQYVKSIIRFKRYHHYVNWKKHFKQPLIKV